MHKIHEEKFDNKDLRNKIDKIRNKIPLFRKLNVDYAETVINFLENNIEKLEQQPKSKFAKECNDIPIFKYYDPFQMFQRISCASNEDIVSIREMLAERAKHHKKEIEPEMANIAKLRQIMEDYVDGKRPTIKTVMIEEFAKELDNILNMYKPKKLSLLGPKQDEE